MIMTLVMMIMMMVMMMVQRPSLNDARREHS